MKPWLAPSQTWQAAFEGIHRGHTKPNSVACVAGIQYIGERASVSSPLRLEYAQPHEL